MTRLQSVVALIWKNMVYRTLQFKGDMNTIHSLLNVPDQTNEESFRVSIRVLVIGESFRVSL